MTRAYLPFVQFASSNGDGTGTVDMSVNGASVAQVFTVDAPAGSGGIVISRVIWEMNDVGTINAGTFAAASALTNGVNLKIVDSSDTEIVDLFPQPVKTNADLQRYSYDVSLEGGGTGLVTMRLSFNRFMPAGLVLDDGEKLEITVNDDLTGLTEFEVCAEGYYLAQTVS